MSDSVMILGILLVVVVVFVLAWEYLPPEQLEQFLDGVAVGLQSGSK